MNVQATAEPQEICPVCGGTGWEFVPEKGVRECDCVRSRRIDTALSNARIPDRFKSSSFENFEAGTPSLQRALAQSKRFVDDVPASDRGLLYLGSCGLGKTHLSCASLGALIRKGLTGIFYDFRGLLKEIQNSYNPGTQSAELKVLAPVLNADVLVLDELGAAKPTAWVQETVTYIVNERYNGKKTTIFTSNYLDVAVGGFDESLTERVGTRLRSRLHEMCRLVSIEGEDYRLKIRNKASR